MKTPSLAVVFLLLAAAPVELRAQTESASASATTLDFGDHSSQTLTGKAWKALEAKKFDEVKGYTGKCRELYETKAIEMQKTLKEPAPSEKAHDFWALNDVGTCYFILAKSLEAQDKKPEALAAYKALVEKLAFAQCWDTNGWFWKPADAAKDRLKALEFDSL